MSGRSVLPRVPFLGLVGARDSVGSCSCFGTVDPCVGCGGGVGRPVVAHCVSLHFRVGLERFSSVIIFTVCRCTWHHRPRACVRAFFFSLDADA